VTVKVWLAPWATETAPEGEIDPPAPALAVMVQGPRCAGGADLGRESVQPRMVSAATAEMMPSPRPARMSLLQLRRFAPILAAPGAGLLRRISATGSR
jgi:hypothetical protein